MGTYTKNLKLETPNYTESADIPALTKKNNEIIDSEMIKRANGLDYNEQTGVLQLTGNNSKVGSPIQIKNNLPVTSMSSGTELKVNNYKQLIKFTKEGKTEQKTYTGKNLLNYIDNLQSTNGLTNTINSDGSITTTGKPTTDYMKIVKTQNFIDFFEDGETYTISQQQPNEKLFIQVNAKKKDGTYSYYFGNKGKSTFKVDKDTYVSYFIGVQTHTMSMWGDSPLTITNKYMLYKGTDTADTSYEPYVGATASPNPDYPQSLENVKGIKNLANINDIKIGKTWQNVSTNSRASIIQIKINPNTTYTLNSNYKINSNFTTCRAMLFNNISGAVKYATNDIGTFNSKECNYLSIELMSNTSVTEEMLNGIWISLVEGTEAQNIQYGTNYLSFKNVGKNLFNYTPVLITQVKSNLRTNNIYPDSNILLKKGTYILSFPDMVMKNNIKEFGVQLFDNNTQLATLTLSNNKKSAIFTINNDANINRLYTYLDNSDNNDATITYKNIQLEKGTVATDYESYEKKYINIDLQGNELCSNLDKTTNDELIVENSKAKINKIIKEFTFTGDEEFTKRSDGDGSTTITFNLPIHEDIVELNTVSNMFSYEQSSTSGNEGMGVSIGNNKLVYIQIKRSRLSSIDVAGFKEFLKAKYNAGTPLKIQCELIEPEVTDLGKVDFDLIENSTLTCEEKSDMQIDYLTISSNIFVQDNLDGNSNQKAPSVDAVNKAINKISNYSSEEQCIGEWFGEKHYRKVFEIDMDSTLKQMTIPTGIDMKQLTHAYGVALNSDTIYLPLNFYNNLGWDSFHLVGKGANIILQRGDNFSITKVFITLEYTKNV